MTRHFGRSEFRTFSNPADRATWGWVAGAVIVAIVLTFLALAGRDHARLASGNDPLAPERALVPPITQPAAPAEAGDQTQL